MKIVELTRETWPALETLFAANKTVGGCWCVWFMRPHAEVQAGWGADNKAFLRKKVGAPLGLLAIRGEEPLGWVAVDYARERGAAAVEGHPVDTEGERRGSGDLCHGTLEMFLAAGFDLVDRRGTRRALVRRELT